MKTKWLIGLIFFFAPLLLATPIKLTVQPKGTNQVELTLGPIMPDVFYEVLARTNGPDGHWITVAGYIGGSNKTISAACDLGGVQGLTLQTLNNWKFVAGRWDDSQGDELPALYKELILRIDPFSSGDPYGNLMGDGWGNLQKLQNNMDPFSWYPPPAPQANVNFFQGTNDIRHGNAILTWRVLNGPVPDYFLIERANRTLRPITNNPYFQRPPLGARFGAFGTNRPPFDPRFSALGTNRLSPGERFGVFGTNRPPPDARFGAYGTNLPPNFRLTYGRPPGSPREEPLVTGPFEVVARAPGRAGLSEYRYVDPNVDTLFQPAYRIQPHYSPPLHARLHQVDAAEIRKTIISVVAQPTTNGYALTVPHPIPYAWYLLLVRDKNDPQWRASGYFASGTNRDPVDLPVDKKGMMHEGQSPIAMPEVKFLPDVVKPEFTAGWGEDSDGDGLPDVYEVLVTHTDPDNADTGNTGILDGYKEMTGDGWSNLEKFRRRIDPLRPAQPPPTVELKQPTESEIMNAVMPKMDLNCDLQLEVRTNGATNFQPIEQIPWMLSKIMNFRQPNDRKNFDLRISWQFAEPKANQYENNPFGRGEASFQALESLIQKMSVQLAETFKTNLATSPPLSPNDASNKMAAIEHAYRQGEMDKGLAMAEMMMLQDNQSQDFYGKVVDQYGQPVVGADVNVEVNLEMGRGSPQKTQTDAVGLFQFTRLRGRSLSITPEKKGFQIQGHGLGLKGLNGPETSPNNRAVYTMWKLKGPEPMIHDQKRYNFKPDDRIYTIDLLSKKMAEGTNDVGDLLVQIQRPPQIKPREDFEWSFTMTAIGGGVIEVTNDDYLNEAPASGYQPQYKLNLTPANPRWRGWNGEETFYLKSRDGKVYGHFHIRINPFSRDGSSLEIESYVNPAGSRNLEFDPAKQTEYTPKPEAAVPSLVPVGPTVNLKTDLSHTRTGGVQHLPALPDSPSNQTSVVIYKCMTIGGLHGVKGATDGTNGASLFNQPWGIAADKKGSVYVAEWGNSTIRKLTLVLTNWVVSTIAGIAGKEGSNDGTNADARLNHPHGIVADDEGDLYVADTFNNTVRKIKYVGGKWVVTTIAGQVGVFGSVDGTNTGAQFNNPGGITIDRRGDLFVTDVQNNSIRKLTPAGSNWVVTTVAGLGGNIRDGRALRPAYGSSDGTNSDARFFAPFGIAADSHDNLYVADYENSTIRKITRSGTNWVVTTIAGLAEVSGYVDGTNSAARFDHPRALAIDKADNIYVDDPGTDTIRMIKCVGTNYVVQTVVGLPWRWGYADGTNNTPQFDSASGIAVDRTGNIYLADTGNDTVRQIVPPFVPTKHTNSIAIMLVGILALLMGFFALNRIFRQAKCGKTTEPSSPNTERKPEEPDQER
jgi:hypothetical protein